MKKKSGQKKNTQVKILGGKKNLLKYSNEVFVLRRIPPLDFRQYRFQPELTSNHWESVVFISSTHKGSDLEPMSRSRRWSQDTVSSTFVTHWAAMSDGRHWKWQRREKMRLLSCWRTERPGGGGIQASLSSSQLKSNVANALTQAKSLSPRRPTLEYRCGCLKKKRKKNTLVQSFGNGPNHTGYRHSSGCANLLITPTYTHAATL